jgi:hypothetical protein
MKETITFWAGKGLTDKLNTLAKRRYPDREDAMSQTACDALDWFCDQYERQPTLSAWFWLNVTALPIVGHIAWGRLIGLYFRDMDYLTKA